MLQKCKWYWHYHTALQSEAQLFHLPIIPYTGQWKPYSQPLCSGVPGHPQRSTSSYINPWYCPPSCPPRPPPSCWPAFHNWDHRSWQLRGHLIINFTCSTPDTNFHPSTIFILPQFSKLHFKSGVCSRTKALSSTFSKFVSSSKNFLKIVKCWGHRTDLGLKDFSRNTCEDSQLAIFYPLV